MLYTLRKFKNDKKDFHALEAYCLEMKIPYFWIGSPAASSRLPAIIASIIAGITLTVYFFVDFGRLPWATLTFSVALILFVPYIIMRDWLSTEYAVTPEGIIVKPGITSNEERIYLLRDYPNIDVHQSRIGSALDFVSLQFFDADDVDPKKKQREQGVSIHGIPTIEARLLISAITTPQKDDVSHDRLVKDFKAHRRNVLHGIRDEILN